MINKALSPKKTREDRIQIPVKDDIYYFFLKVYHFKINIFPHSYSYTCLIGLERYYCLRH